MLADNTALNSSKWMEPEASLIRISSHPICACPAKREWGVHVKHLESELIIRVGLYC